MDNNAKNQKVSYVIIIVTVLVLLISIFGYIRGYRLQNNFLIGKLGVLTLELPLFQTNVFIDEGKK